MPLPLARNPTPDAASLWLRQLVREFGLGFHLDTSPEDYVQPDGAPVFTPDQCVALRASLESVFVILGQERPYEICADAAAQLPAEARGWKPPLHYHDPAFQQQLLRHGTREELIAWLCWNDPNGVYTDRESLAEDRSILTLETARLMAHEQFARD